MPSPFDAHPPQGYVRCSGCGVLVSDSYSRQSHGCCPQCWRDRSPLASIEVVHGSVRSSAHSVLRAKRRKKVNSPPAKGPDLGRRAKGRAMERLRDLFPELYAMLVDEERAQLGLEPLIGHETLDFEETASKTLAFEAVYDALKSEGVSDA